MPSSSFKRVMALAALFGIALAVATNSLVSAQATIVVFVPELAKVRVGPGTIYDQLGELTQGQTAPATGRSQYNDWVQIDFPSGPLGKGWVYLNLIELRGGTVDQLPLAQTPPTATLPPTPAGDSNPILNTPVPTRRPTYTPAPAVTMPAYVNAAPAAVGFPSAFFISGLFLLGIFGVVMAVIRRNA